MLNKGLSNLLNSSHNKNMGLRPVTNRNGTPKWAAFMEIARSGEESVRSMFVTEASNHFVCFVSAGRHGGQ